MTYDYAKLWTQCWDDWCKVESSVEDADAGAVSCLQREIAKAFVPRDKFRNRADRLKEATTALTQLQKDNAALTEALRKARTDQVTERKLAASTSSELRNQIYDLEKERDELRRDLEILRTLLVEMSTRGT